MNQRRSATDDQESPETGPDSPSSPGDRGRTLTRAVLAWSLVLEMAILAMLGLWAGHEVDEFLGTSPVFLVLLSFVGFVLGIFLIVRHLRSR